MLLKGVITKMFLYISLVLATRRLRSCAFASQPHRWSSVHILVAPTYSYGFSSCILILSHTLKIWTLATVDSKCPQVRVYPMMEWDLSRLNYLPLLHVYMLTWSMGAPAVNNSTSTILNY